MQIAKKKKLRRELTSFCACNTLGILLRKFLQLKKELLFLELKSCVTKSKLLKNDFLVMRNSIFCLLSISFLFAHKRFKHFLLNYLNTYCVKLRKTHEGRLFHPVF